ncbi:MAG: transcription termination factor Rho [Butyrivibrio sp.]|nr:transcription termination factor Rho [Butyrivibrio sp.]
MKEKYESLKLADLREIAKAAGIKGATGMKKSELVEALCAAEAARTEAAEPKKAPVKHTKKIVTVTAAPVEKKEEKAPLKKKAEKAEASEKEEVVTEKKAEKAPKHVEKKSDKQVTSEKKTAKKEEAENGKKAEKQSSPSNPQQEKKHIVKADVNATADAEPQTEEKPQEKNEELADGIPANGILEIMQDGFGFIRCENYLPGEKDVYVAPGLIKKFNLKTGDILSGICRQKKENDKFGALLHLQSINGYDPEVAMKRWDFEKMTPIFPDQKIHLESPSAPVSMRIMDLICPIGKGQRGMIVAPPKAGKTTLLKSVAKAVKRNHPDIHLIILLIDERPEEVTDIKEAIEGPNAEVIYSTFDELPEHHKRVAEMVMERAKRLVEHKKDVMILLDSITRLTRAYNIVVPPSGRTLSGGLDPAALHMPKKFFGAARNMRQGGSLTILATALIETGSKMDDVVYEEFKGTGNMEMVLDRKLQEKRIFPAINILKSSTRREDLLLTGEELAAVNTVRKGFNGMKADEAVDQCINMFSKTRNNFEFVKMVEKNMIR